MDWLSYYDLAREWAECPEEAYKRSAISRAYYAMYCIARNKLKDADRYHPPKCGSDHIYVWNSYKDDLEYPDRVQVGVLGTRLRQARNKADYDDFVDHFSDVVETALLDAADLKDYLEDLRI